MHSAGFAAGMIESDLILESSGMIVVFLVVRETIGCIREDFLICGIEV